MNIVTAGTLFAVIILIYWIIWELFSMLFRFTGFPDDKARFQVLSLLTGCGFTTRESESLLAAKPRRRLTQVTMLFGYVFNVTIVTAFVNVFLSMKSSQFDNYLFGLMIPISIAVFIILITKVGPIRIRIDRVFEKIAGKIVKKDSANTLMLVDSIGHDSIAQVTLRNVPQALQGKTLAEMDIKTKENIMVMLIERADKTVETAGANTVILQGDKLTVFGNYKSISRVFEAKERF